RHGNPAGTSRGKPPSCCSTPSWRGRRSVVPMIWAHVEERFHQAFLHVKGCGSYGRKDRSDDHWRAFETVDAAVDELAAAGLTVDVCERCNWFFPIEAGLVEVEEMSLDMLPSRQPATP